MLSDKIWITRKARIFSEKRLKNQAIISNIIMIFYSFILVAFSIWNLVYGNETVSMFLVFSAIAVLIATIFLTSQRYTERSILIRTCYIRLDELYSKVKRAEEHNEKDSLEQYESEYAALLLNVENHTNYDYLCLRFSLRNQKNTTLPQFTKKSFWLFIWEKIWRVFLIAICFMLPVLLVLFWEVIVGYGNHQ